MKRMGLNCTLSYQVSGATMTYRVRAGNLSHGVDMISSESVARTVRAFYPHRSAMQDFTVQVLLKNWTERNDFTNWITNYANYAIDPDNIQSVFPWMTVSVPSRKFSMTGVPLQGYEWGAHTGMMMFTPDIVFEAATSPGDTNNAPVISSVINKWSAFKSDTAIQYFYPFGTQLSGNQAPKNYSKIQYPGSPNQYNPPPTPPGPPGHQPLPGF